MGSGGEGRTASRRVVRAGGFEPPRPRTPGPKPGASAGSATLAHCILAGREPTGSRSRGLDLEVVDVPGEVVAGDLDLVAVELARDGQGLGVGDGAGEIGRAHV